MNGGRVAIGAVCVLAGAAGLTLAWATAGSPRAVASRRASLLARAAGVHAASAEDRFRAAMGELVAVAGPGASATVLGAGVVPAGTGWPPLVATADLPPAAAAPVTAAVRETAAIGARVADADVAGRAAIVAVEPIVTVPGQPPAVVAFALVAVAAPPTRAKTIVVIAVCVVALIAGCVLLVVGLRA